MELKPHSSDPTYLSEAMSSNNSRRSLARPSDDDLPPENRQRPVQKALQHYIPEERLPGWGERWAHLSRQDSDITSRNSRVFEHCFKVDTPPMPDDHPPSIPSYSHSRNPTERKKRRKRRRPNCLPSSLQQLSGSTRGPGLVPVHHLPQTPLTPDHASSILPVVCSLPNRPTKRMNRRTGPKRLVLSFQQPQTTSTRTSTEEPGVDTPSSGSFSATSQVESVATSPALPGSSTTPGIVSYPVPQGYDNRSPSMPTYSHYQHEVLAGRLNQYGSQSLPYGVMARGGHSQVPLSPDTTVGWTAENETSLFPPIVQPYYHHGQADSNHREVDAMGGGTFLYDASRNPHLPYWNKPYTRPHGQTLYQMQACYNIDAPDKRMPFPYNLEGNP